MPLRHAAAEVSAGGVITKESKVLLIKMRNLKGEYVWTFPKGHLEGKESPREAALREVVEETGYACSIRSSLGVIKYSFYRGKTYVRKRVRWYWMEPGRRCGRPDANEIFGMRWLPFKEAKARLKYPADFRMLDKAAALVKQHER